tara:strand:+ start:1108 stop:1410 length:303 start_codon:yes stop_codon:yes gene_type:complete
MKEKKNISVGLGILLFAFFLMGSLFQKSEAGLAVIKAGVDQDGNPVCINKSNVYMFKKIQSQNKIIFLYHDPIDDEASITKTFSDPESLDNYWKSLVEKW